MSEPLTREQVETACAAFFNSGDMHYIKQLLAHDASLREQLTTVTEERDAYRHGGVTEEILRRQDGYLKIGRGCCVVLESDWQAQKEAP